VDRRVPMQRVVVVGCTGSGKTTLAAALSHRLDAKHIELDALHWGPNWTPVPNDQFRAQTAEFAKIDRWVADGNYGAVRDLVWGRADTLVWLDYPFVVLLYRLTRRILQRGIRRQELWNGNRENLRTHFLSRDSLFLWLVKSYRRRQREYPLLLARPEYAHLAVCRFQRPAEADEWLGKVQEIPAGDVGSDEDL